MRHKPSRGPTESDSYSDSVSDSDSDRDSHAGNGGHPYSFVYPPGSLGAVCPLWIHVKPAKFATLALFAAITPKLQLAKVSIRNWNQLWQSQRIQVGMKT